MGGHKTAASTRPANRYIPRRMRQWVEPLVGLAVMVAELTAM